MGIHYHQSLGLEIVVYYYADQIVIDEAYSGGILIAFSNWK
jgi:hypothetical protein